MSSPPQSRPQWRHPRARLDGNNPIILRFPNGQRIGANLQVISLTGGLLSVPKSIDQGSQVRLMFMTEAGSVLGGAEMLPPVSDRLQPFRFISLPVDDQRRVGTLIGERSQDKSEKAWMEKLRAASAQQNESPFWRFKRAGVIGLVTIGLAIGAYVLHFGLLK